MACAARTVATGAWTSSPVHSFGFGSSSSGTGQDRENRILRKRGGASTGSCDFAAELLISPEMFAPDILLRYPAMVPSSVTGATQTIFPNPAATAWSVIIFLSFRYPWQSRAFFPWPPQFRHQGFLLGQSFQKM